MWPPRSSLRVLHCPPRGLALLGAALRGGRVAPTFVTACSSLPPEGATAPAGRQSRTRGPGLNEEPLRSLTACSFLPAEGAAALGARLCRFRGPCLKEKPGSVQLPTLV